jgi:N-acetylmuramoyl-L-alanine amidase
MYMNTKSRTYWIAAVAMLVLILSGSFAARIAPEKPKIKVVCIDPGHGGKDPGCHGDKTYEKDVALAVALKLGEYINKHFPDIKVVYTRKTDVFVELNERAAIANRNKADLFICIHCNSACVRSKKTKKDICNEEAQGSETYVMGLHKTEGNLEVAKRENDAVKYEDDYENKYDMSINTDEAVIILSAYQNLYLDQSVRFAELCQIQFSAKAGRANKGVKQAGFLVLWKTSMPSVLIETGFLTNPAEERFLGSAKGQTHMAACIFRAFRKWKDEVEGTTKNYDDDLERMPVFKPGVDDTAGLRKPVNHVKNQDAPKPQPQNPKLMDTVITQAKSPADSTVASWSVVYRIQIMASDKQLDNNDSRFKGEKDIWFYKRDNSYKYTVGHFATMQEASKKQNELRKNGFSEAFVVIFNQKGERITAEEAKKLTNAQ